MRRPARTILLPVLAAFVVAGTGCGGDEGDAGDTAAAASEATIKTFIFEPDPLEVDAGTTVTWMNEDDILHTVTSSKGGGADAFDERLDGAGTTAEVAFEKRGTYEYLCSVHDGMEGTVVVR